MRLVRDLAALIVGLLLGGFVVSAFAQSATPPAPPPTCEQQLEQARADAIDLKKKKAQAEYQSASVEEYALACKKQLDAAKAAEAPKAAATAPGNGQKK